MRRQKSEKVAQDMRAWNGLAQLFEKRLQELFHGLLAMKTELVMKGFLSSAELDRQSIIGLGLSYPFPCQLFHKGSFRKT